MGLFSFGGNAQQDADDEQPPVRPRRSARAPEEEPMDPMLPEKKRARRRLIGATALVLAAVIGLPMIFDSEPRPISQDITIQIPPRDKAPPMSASPMPLPPGPVAPVEPPGANSATSTNAATVAANTKPDTKPDTKQADSTTAATESDAAAKDKAATIAVGEKQRVDSLVDKPGATPSEATKSADKDKSRYIVQVAAVSSKAKVDDLLQKLKRGGIEGYWQKVNTKEGERFRVRVGPFASRDEAEKMAKRIDKLGLPGTIQAI
ncbi:MAG: SPOR domain-containing protein [Betaproteobacteria bacterium]